MRLGMWINTSQGGWLYPDLGCIPRWEAQAPLGDCLLFIIVCRSGPSSFSTLQQYHTTCALEHQQYHTLSVGPGPLHSSSEGGYVQLALSHMLCCPQPSLARLHVPTDPPAPYCSRPEITYCDHKRDDASTQSPLRGVRLLGVQASKELDVRLGFAR